MQPCRERDHKALTKGQIIHLDRYQILHYQWRALDVNPRFKIFAIPGGRVGPTGSAGIFWVIYWLRANGVKAQIVFIMDNGEEFYIPRVLHMKSEVDLLDEVTGYWHSTPQYNTQRKG
jgi:hypothetical protein